MSTEVKIGQVWRDKDKRRSTTIEIIALDTMAGEVVTVTGLVVGTEKERKYAVERLIARWELVATKADVSEILAEELREEGLDVNEKAEPKPKHKTREQWLQAAVKELTKSIFRDFDVPEVRVSVGWPGGRGKKTGVIGQCFATKTTDDKVAQIFISPVLANPYEVVETMAHEIIHAIDDCESGHKKNFVKIAKEIGFLAPWKSTPASDDLRDRLQAIADKLGVYPHAAIRPEDRPTVQKTYMLKVVCPEDDEFFVRMTQSKIDDFGFPFCPCHNVEMELEVKP